MRNVAILTTIGFLLACGGAGEAAPDVTNAQKVTYGSVSFQLPANWTVETAYEPGIRNTTINSSGNALLMVQEFDEAVGIDAATYADALRTEYQNEIKANFGDAIQMTPGAIGTVNRKWFGAEVEGATVPVDLGAFGVVVPHTLEVFERDVNGHTLIVFTQVAVEDSATVRPGFDLILQSMTAP